MPFRIESCYEFHVSRRARERYGFPDFLFGFNGNVILADFRAARVFAERMNARRDLIRFPEQAVQASQINAMGLIDEILHLVLARYRQERNAAVFGEALGWLGLRVGDDALRQTLRRFVVDFPPIAVYRGDVSVDDYLAGTSNGVPNEQLALEELIMLWLANQNPAQARYRELFDDTDLAQHTAYRQVMTDLRVFLDAQPTFGPNGLHLLDLLRAPALASPDSLEGQLAYIRDHWADWLGELLVRLLSSLDFIHEEFHWFRGMGGPGPVELPDYRGDEVELEMFSPDREWMPQLVLIAKNAYVWLDQLSREFGRPIRRLDEIPDEALAVLARRGFTGLWLIGLWERSPASQRIKQLSGNADAVASAYSIFDYRIADDLGGDAACRALRVQAWRHGIRLASDMVPNHVGIDSRWVIQHPDWFISCDESPFPAYQFSGPDLSNDERVGIYLEDHYYARTDAAVVFRRHDRWTGTSRYLYHGNDGTSMPWNDTAQLNYLRADVREAVIQTILHVARQFPIIRFDAAMTLTKRHFQRLWFPEPGTGGDIPSRAGQGMTRQQLDAFMPTEFWREVVDRVAREAPDTLLLAEAFWLLEGYFVRTLGMHRVYNSAFMNLLRDEDNAKYRQLMKNTLEFEPEILRRFVSFMNNPDERTAVDQFGKGDKYFGTCTMLATLPGLPMFGHGQIEGYAEKYGMEFRRPQWDEQPDADLVARHEREITPLLRRRALFAGVENFRLYDFFTGDGTVNEDVFAYSNRLGAEAALIVYNNRYARASGWIRASAAYGVKVGEGDERRLVQTTLGDGLGLSADDNHFCVFRDNRTGLEYLRASSDLCEQGLFVELGAYQYHAFIEVRQVQDDARGSYRRLAAALNGSGVASVTDALRELELEPVRAPVAALINGAQLRRIANVGGSGTEADQNAALTELEDQAAAMLAEVGRQSGNPVSPLPIARGLRKPLAAILALPRLDAAGVARAPVLYQEAFSLLCPSGAPGPDVWGTLYAWVIVRSLGRVTDSKDGSVAARAWFDEWMLGKLVRQALADAGGGPDDADRALAAIKLLLATDGLPAQAPLTAAARRTLLETWLKDPDVRDYLGVHRYGGVLWYRKEAFEELLGWLTLGTAIAGREESTTAVAGQAFGYRWRRVVHELRQLSDAAGYQVDRLVGASP
jgi:glycosidase